MKNKACNVQIMQDEVKAKIPTRNKKAFMQQVAHTAAERRFSQKEPMRPFLIKTNTLKGLQDLEPWLYGSRPNPARML